MILGNTAGRNKGKKYIKLKGDEVATAQNQAKADLFKHWFGQTYTRLQTELINKDTYNEDILNDTFLRIYDKIRFGGLEIRNYKAYFHRAFFTNFMQVIITNSKGITTSIDSSFDCMDESENDSTKIQTRSHLVTDVLDYVAAKYPVAEYRLYEKYIQLKPEITYASLAEITGLESLLIATTIGKIRKDVSSNQYFKTKRKDLD